MSNSGQIGIAMSNAGQRPGRCGVVAAGSPAAADAGAEMLRLGGTAADAAVAAALATCVTDPANASLLGRCQIVLRTSEGRFAAIDGASAIPHHLPHALGSGPLACAAIPGLPQALDKLHTEHGRLPLELIAAPAVRLAEEGFAAPKNLAAVWALRADAIAEGGAGPYLDDLRPPAHISVTTSSARCFAPSGQGEPVQSPLERPPGAWPKGCAPAAGIGARRISRPMLAATAKSFTVVSATAVSRPSAARAGATA